MKLIYLREHQMLRDGVLLPAAICSEHVLILDFFGIIPATLFCHYPQGPRTSGLPLDTGPQSVRRGLHLNVADIRFEALPHCQCQLRP